MTDGIVITGLGAHTHFGGGTKALLHALEQQAPLSGSTCFDAGGTRVHELRHLSRSAAAFAAAAEEAWRAAGLPDRLEDADRFALLEGSSLGPLPDAIEAMRSTARVRPTDLLRFMAGSGGVHFAQRHGIEGTVSGVCAGSASGALAIVDGVRLIRTGAADVVVAGAVDRPMQDDIVQRFRAAGILTADCCRPYATDRNGTTLADAAGAIILESRAHAARRGAPVYGQLCAADVATESADGATPDPTGDGVAHATRKVMATFQPARISWIKGHGTGTPKGDASECAGLRCALGPAFARIPITSLKSTLGHSLGASGMVECIAAVLAAHRGFVPATSGTRVPDPLLNIDLVTEPRPFDGAGVILMLSQSFGGRCAALVVSVCQC
ncbi:MAG: hypothetical protein FIB01_05485 [Gemmatimonadetes bacterium]|nr:hypothetical protein [Gemmatimonadota bacterium]